MSYIGNQVTSVPYIIDTFTGNGVTTAFGPLTRAPAGTASIAVFIAGTYRIPGIDYTLNGLTINFTTAPLNTQTIIIHHLGNGTTTQVPSDGSVTGAKIAGNAIRGNNIVAGQITSNLLATNSITGNLLGLNSVSGNNISINSINASNSITSGSITGNLIGAYAVSGNQIGTGAISANNFAGGGITSNVLASNLSISTVRVAETINVTTTAIGGNYDIHIANSTVYYFMSNTTANVTFNFVANNGTATGTTGNLNDLIKVGQTASIAIILKQGSTRYRANVFIDSVRANGIYWLGNSQPLYQTTQQQSVDAYNFTIIKVADQNYTVLASNSTFSHANGQGMGATNGSVY